MKQVLSVIHYPIFGGPTNQALRLADPLRHRGFETVVAITDEPGNSIDRLASGGVAVEPITLHRARRTLKPKTHLAFIRGFAADIERLRQLIRQHNIDVVQVNGLINPHGAIAARLEGRAVVWQLLDTRPPWVLRLAVFPLIAWLADIVMTTGLRVARVHPGIARMRRLRPYFPPVDLEFPVDSKGDARTTLQLSPSDFVVGTIGNINPQKGHEVLLRAVCILREQGVPAQVRILGARTPTHAAYYRSLRTIVEDRLGDDPDAVLVEFGARTPNLASAFDIFAVTSVPRSEGIPTAMLEAMAIGLPIVATDVGGVLDAVTDGKEGLIVPPNEPEAVAAAIESIFRDGSQRDAMAAAAKARATASYGLDPCADVHAKAYSEALARRGTRGHKGAGA